MANSDFVLKSGTNLHVTTARFEVAVALVEAVKKATNGQDPSADFASTVLANPEVRKAALLACETVMYGTVRVGTDLFDDPKLGEKARGDYFEIMGRVIESNCKSFFLKTSLSSKELQGTQEKSPAQP